MIISNKIIEKTNFYANPKMILKNIYTDELDGCSLERIIEILNDNPSLNEISQKVEIDDNVTIDDISHAKRVKYYIIHPEQITPVTIELWHFKKYGYQHIILDGWHRINAAAILGINIVCGNFYGTKDVYSKIKVK